MRQTTKSDHTPLEPTSAAALRGAPAAAPTIGQVPWSWILTGSPENYAATRSRDFSVIGLKERNRNRALEIEPSDRIIFYLTRVKALGGCVRVEGDLYEDRTKIWPGKPGKADAYPWRFATSPEIVLDEPHWIPVEPLAGELEHVAKWPPEHWTLAFQGQVRVVSDHDAQILLERMTAAAGAPV
jgi:EVE domain